jgi:hypothetical protein
MLQNRPLCDARPKKRTCNDGFTASLAARRSGRL